MPLYYDYSSGEIKRYGDDGTELYHVSPRKGYSKRDHKYTRREWKNGHWVYYYEDGTKTVNYQKGQNYSSMNGSTVPTTPPTSSASASASKTVSNQNSWLTTVDKLETKFKSFIETGKQKLFDLDVFMHTKLSDLLNRSDNEEHPKGQNYKTR